MQKLFLNKVYCITCLMVFMTPQVGYAQSSDWLDYLNGIQYDFKANSVRPAPLSDPSDLPTPTVIEEDHLDSPQGSLSVTSDGTMSYILPFEVLPGRGGVQPGLALRYDSAAGNSYFGLGWKMAGMSRIERCVKSLAQQDSSTPRLNPTAKRAVTYTKDDDYCLDGVPLFLSAGEYRTERESFRRVKKISDYRFEARDNRGWLYEYGVVEGDGAQCVVSALQDCDALEVNENGSAYAWHIKRIQDPHGNTMEFFYDQLHSADGSTLWIRPWEIAYNKHMQNSVTTQQATRRIRFNYESREDIRRGYAKGVVFDVSVRIASLDVISDTRVEHSYLFEYAAQSTDPVLFADHGNPSRLISVFKRTNGNGSLSHDSAKTRFEWSDTTTTKPNWDDTPDISKPTSDTSLPYVVPPVASPAIIMDVNGDMRTDVFHTPVDPNGTITGCNISVVQPDAATFVDYAVKLRDENGNTLGIDSSGENEGWDCPALLFSKYPAMATDYNQDGYDDLLILQYPFPGTGNTTRYQPIVFLNEKPDDIHKTVQFRMHVLPFNSTVDAYVPSQKLAHYYTPSPAIWYLDFNGDGLEDFAYCAGEADHIRYWLRGVNGEILPSIHSSASFDSYPSTSGLEGGRIDVPCAARRNLVADVDGDGAMDLLFAKRTFQQDFQSHWAYGTNETNTFIAYSYYKQDGVDTGISAYPESDNYFFPDYLDEEPDNKWWLLNNAFRLIDYNGDGLQDVMVAHLPSLRDSDCIDSNGCPEKWFIDVWLNKGKSLKDSNTANFYERIRINSASTANPSQNIYPIRHLAPDVSLYLELSDALDAHHRHLRAAFLSARVFDYNGDGRSDLLLPKVEQKYCNTSYTLFGALGGKILNGLGYYRRETKYRLKCSYPGYNKPDILDGVVGKWVVWLATDNGFVEHNTNIDYQAFIKKSDNSTNTMYTGPAAQQPLILDLEGEGRPSLLLQRHDLSSGTANNYYGETDLYRFNRKTSNLITKIRHGSIGIDEGHAEYDDTVSYEITYKPMSDTIVYSPEDRLVDSRHPNSDTPAATTWCDYPVLCVRSRRPVVHTVSKDRGPYVNPALNYYFYSVYRIDLLADRSLGFVKTNHVDADRNQYTQRFYEDENDYIPGSTAPYDTALFRFPYARLLKSESRLTTVLSSGEQNEVKLELEYSTLPVSNPDCFYNSASCPTDNRHFIPHNHKKVEVERHSAQNGVFRTLNDVETTVTLDALGRTTHVTKKAGAGDYMMGQPLRPYFGEEVLVSYPSALPANTLHPWSTFEANTTHKTWKRLQSPDVTNVGDDERVVMSQHKKDLNTLAVVESSYGVGESFELKLEKDYDVYGNVTRLTSTDVNRQASDSVRVVETSYDPSEHQFVVSQTNALGYTQQRTIDSVWGNTNCHWDKNNLKTCIHRDDLRRVIRVARPNGQHTLYHHDQLIDQNGHRHKLLHTSTSGGAERVVVFDRLNRPAKVYYPDFNGDVRVLSNEIDVLGRRVTSLLPELASNQSSNTWDFTRFEYDAFDRIKRKINADNTVSLWQYSIPIEYKQWVVQTNPRGTKNKTLYNNMGYVSRTEQEDPTGSQNTWVIFEQDAKGKVNKTIKPAGISMIAQTDVYGRISSLNDPATGTTASTYNAFGEVIHQTHNGDARSYVHDVGGRVSSVNLTGRENGSIDYTWSSQTGQLGTLQQVQGVSGHITSYEYDQYNRPVTKTLALNDNFGDMPSMIEGSYTFTFGYDAHGRQNQVVYPVHQQRNNVTVNYEFDEFGRTEKVLQSGAQANTLVWERTATDRFGRNTEEVFGNDAITSVQTNALNGLVEVMQTSVPDPQTSMFETIQELHFSHDENRNVIARADLTSGSKATFEHYSYDYLDRLVSSNLCSSFDPLSDCTPNHALSYNGNGDMLSKSDIGAYAYTNAISGQVELIQLNAKGQSAYNQQTLQMTYDAYGNINQYLDFDITYTSSNKPKRYEKATGETIDVEYDAMNDRVLKRVESDAGLSWQVFFSKMYQRVYDDNEGAWKEVLHIDALGSGQVARITFDQDGANRLEYLHDDPQGTTNTVTDVDGNPIEYLCRDPFGAKVDCSDWSVRQNTPLASSTSLDFTGHLSEQNLGLALIDMGGRSYDPLMGRVMSADPYIQAPLFTQSHNRYSYVWNNPLTFNDPSGYQVEGYAAPGQYEQRVTKSTDDSKFVDEETNLPAQRFNFDASLNETKSDTKKSGSGTSAPESGKSRASKRPRVPSTSSSTGKRISRKDYNELWDSFQNAVDVAGMIPGFGEPFDLLNAWLYAKRGKHAEAAMSAASIIPVFGASLLFGKTLRKVKYRSFKHNTRFTNTPTKPIVGGMEMKNSPFGELIDWPKKATTEAGAMSNARRSIEKLSPQVITNMRQKGITRDMVKEWRDFYHRESLGSPPRLDPSVNYNKIYKEAKRRNEKIGKVFPGTGNTTAISRYTYLNEVLKRW